jgi:hypothetical protein
VKNSNTVMLHEVKQPGILLKVKYGDLSLSLRMTCMGRSFTNSQPWGQNGLPSPARAGERGEGVPSQDSRPGLKYFAPSGLSKERFRRGAI